MKIESSQTITDDFSKTLTTPKRLSLKIEYDRGKEFYNSFFQNFFILKIIHQFSQFTDKSPSIAEQLIKNILYFLGKPVFLKKNSAWITELTSIVSKYKNTKQDSTKTTAVEASKTVHGKTVYYNLQNIKEKRKPHFHLGDLVRTTDIRKLFSKRD